MMLGDIYEIIAKSEHLLSDANPAFASFYRLTIFQGIVWWVQDFFVAKTFEADI